MSDTYAVTTVETTTITREQVEAEAKRFAMRSGGIFLMAMAERGLTEDSLAAMLDVDKRQIRSLLMGERWKPYMPLAAMCLALGIRMELKTTREM